jgi:hypothetical protein
MNSRQKLEQFVSMLLENSDSDLSTLLPFPVAPGVLRGLLTMVEENLPTDPAELDHLIYQAISFCHSLLSDTPQILDA